MTQSPHHLPHLPRASLIRRLAAAAYDLLLLTALLFVVGLILVLINGGQAINISPAIPVIGFFFFGYFWTRAGQTLGMRAWRIALVNQQGQRISWAQALKRYLGAGVSLGLCGLGFFWSLIARDSAAWHDSWSESILIYTPEENPLDQDGA